MDSTNVTGSITNPVYVALHQGTNANLSQLTKAGTANFSSLIQELTIANSGVVASLNSIATAIASTLPRLIGTFTVDAATGSTLVLQPGILANGFPVLTPSNLTAGIVVFAQGLFVASVTPGVGFTMNTITGTAAVGSIFSYFIVNPI